MTQHHVWALVCYCVGLVAGLAGGYGVITGAFAARAARKVPLMVNNGDGTATINSSQVDAVVKAQALPWWSMVALVGGVVVGFVGNLLSL